MHASRANEAASQAPTRGHVGYRRTHGSACVLSACVLSASRCAPCWGAGVPVETRASQSIGAAMRVGGAARVPAGPPRTTPPFPRPPVGWCVWWSSCGQQSRAGCVCVGGQGPQYTMQALHNNNSSSSMCEYHSGGACRVEWHACISGCVASMADVELDEQLERLGGGSAAALTGVHDQGGGGEAPHGHRRPRRTPSTRSGCVRFHSARRARLPPRVDTKYNFWSMQRYLDVAHTFCAIPEAKPQGVEPHWPCVVGACMWWAVVVHTLGLVCHG